MRAFRSSSAGVESLRDPLSSYFRNPGCCSVCQLCLDKLCHHAMLSRYPWRGRLSRKPSSGLKHFENKIKSFWGQLRSSKWNISLPKTEIWHEPTRQTNESHVSDLKLENEMRWRRSRKIESWCLCWKEIYCKNSMDMDFCTTVYWLRWLKNLEPMKIKRLGRI